MAPLGRPVHRGQPGPWCLTSSTTPWRGRQRVTGKLEMLSVPLCSRPGSGARRWYHGSHSFHSSSTRGSPPMAWVATKRVETSEDGMGDSARPTCRGWYGASRRKQLGVNRE